MNIFEKIEQYGVVPVIAIDAAADAVPLADALLEGGLPVAEITFRTDAALDSIAAISSQRPELLVGAGTVLTESQVDDAKAAGAKFALSPGLDLDVLLRAEEVGLPFAPGIMTPTDLQAALKAGCKMVKFFPAMAAGGPNLLRNIAAPYAHTEIGFNPTGGVTLENLDQWLSMPTVRAVGGTWIATKADIANGDWAQITEKAKMSVDRAAKIRSAQ
ncbi:bifunctional 4-hydroxy-2-oxoglutarate aldolase/2-dehydro-3-deoxy-phosphogluconate aldolase [Planktomarina temperata]|nr:bifunctional 4-hydroxy-2-oxoglutarate aldolase/2-dehydro-3-deoxy-phosphogluconate aldolase [Paracoccaceae bacterium]MDA9960499.1 bifunctional 4-hydroxy-2-oxoglutarate aldolase/2-dehydro-3-deoxy-phosphogluconate aldolase [Planktomarina temperata]MDB4853731.1 bifunctional 4-hydroxy-2-oxoglutarate aldolase/2-dehydro-3-deoxy-phosphogluconate aldolase [Planktomarina temperata]MDC1271516.1 bifunctional 4-hydroxy-2-oxoglutarate aldolase/2-dehydro-3-deoxy-phosphogluconate aldolase [Planktomarina temp